MMTDLKEELGSIAARWRAFSVDWPSATICDGFYLRVGTKLGTVFPQSNSFRESRLGGIATS